MSLNSNEIRRLLAYVIENNEVQCNFTSDSAADAESLRIRPLRSGPASLLVSLVDMEMLVVEIADVLLFEVRVVSRQEIVDALRALSDIAQAVFLGNVICRIWDLGNGRVLAIGKVLGASRAYRSWNIVSRPGGRGANWLTGRVRFGPYPKDSRG